ncbi:hypothetical protein [Methylobacterium indicum]|uniref:Lipoprotein n=1 Tax=Methylobacterium indicum TaxID=1775910 RepID=A0A8H9C671_9HYPH|nr:hypothetical protein [Methylobacterium indicum]BCM83571.1 hypothetical protein mvi_20320 [Methylobacterium indicum]
MKTVIILVAALAALSVGGCASPGDFCTVAQPRRATAAQRQVMTREQKEQDLTFNRYGAEHCGWRP